MGLFKKKKVEPKVETKPEPPKPEYEKHQYCFAQCYGCKQFARLVRRVLSQQEKYNRIFLYQLESPDWTKPIDWQEIVIDNERKAFCPSCAKGVIR